MIFFIMFYILQLLLLVLSKKFYYSKRRVKILFLLSLTLMIILAVLRIDDPDRESYLKIYSGEQSVIEYGFNYVMHIFKKLNLSDYTFYSFINIVSLSLLFINIWRYSSDKFLSIILYSSYLYLIKDLIEIRSAISISIILFGLRYLKLKKLKFFIIVILSSLFHISMIIWFPMCYLYKLRLNKFKYLSLIFFSFCIGKFIIINTFLEKLNFLLYEYGLINQYMLLKINYHIENVYNSTFSGRTYYYIIITVIFILVMDKYKKRKDYFLYLNTTIYALNLKLLFSNFSTISNRLYENISVVNILLIPIILEKVKPKKVGLMIIIFIEFILYIKFVNDVLLARGFKFIFM